MKDGMAFHRNAPRYFVVVDFRAKVFWQTGFLCINYSDSLPFRICLFVYFCYFCCINISVRNFNYGLADAICFLWDSLTYVLMNLCVCLI